MIPKIEWCNWVFDHTDNMDTDRWMVKRDCCDDEILLVRGDSRNWKAYQASLKPYHVGSYPDAASMCPNCGKFVNGVNPYDDGENTERFLRKPSECFKVVGRGSSNA